MQGATPFDFVKDGVVFLHQGGVEEEPFGEDGLDVSDGFPVDWAEVSTEHKANLEEQVVCKDVRKCHCDIRVVFYLAETDLTSLVWMPMSSVGYKTRRLYARTRISSQTLPNLQWSSEPRGVKVMELTGMESQSYFHEVLKIWWSFRPGFLSVCCGVMKQCGMNLQSQ